MNIRILFSILLFIISVFTIDAQKMLSMYKIAEGIEGFTGTLNEGDKFGCSVAVLNDFDGDNNNEIAVGASGYDDGMYSDVGAVWILFMDDNGRVKKQSLISGVELFDNKGSVVKNVGEIACIGDDDGDGIFDLVVGAEGTDFMTENEGLKNSSGCLFILRLTPEGKMKNSDQIDYITTRSTANYAGVEAGAVYQIGSGSHLGAAVASFDIDNDGIREIIAGYPNFGNSKEGGIVLYKKDAKYVHSALYNVMDSAWNIESFPYSCFGNEITPVGDINGDGITDIAVQSIADIESNDPLNLNDGAIHILFLNENGGIKNRTKISRSENSLGDFLQESERFGDGIVSIGDLNSDGIPDIIASGPKYQVDPPYGSRPGILYFLYMNRDGSVKDFKLLDRSQYDFTGSDIEMLGADMHFLGDINHDGYLEFSIYTNISSEGGFYIASFTKTTISFSGNVLFRDNMNREVLVELIDDETGLTVGSAKTDSHNEFVIVVPKKGKYTLQATPLNGDTTVLQTAIPISIHTSILNFNFTMLQSVFPPDETHVGNKMNVTMYPNPVANYLFFSANENIQSAIIYNLKGQKICMIENIHRNNFSIQISSLKKGTYYCKIVNERGCCSVEEFIKK